MDTGLLIITAQGFDFKILNRVLLSIRDWDAAEGSMDGFFVARHPDELATADKHEVTRPPVLEFTNNAFEGTRFATIEGYMLSRYQEGQGSRIFLVLDDQGLAEETIIVAKRAPILSDDSELLHQDHLMKMRVPWLDANVIHTNLQIANMSFDEYCVEPRAPANGWWTYQPMSRDKEHQEINEKRFFLIGELEKSDHA